MNSIDKVNPLKIISVRARYLINSSDSLTDGDENDKLSKNYMLSKLKSLSKDDMISLINDLELEKIKYKSKIETEISSFKKK